jgi:hypothetical protein
MGLSLKYKMVYVFAFCIARGKPEPTAFQPDHKTWERKVAAAAATLGFI